MVSGFISRLVILIFGTLYPAYASYKAVRTKNVKEYVKWMMYWIVFALFTCAETFTDLFLSFWFPFYYEIKIITVIYLLSPATKGSSILYRKFVHPVLTKREQEIDEYIAKAKEQGYHTMLNLGSKGVNYATSLIMQTAIKGLPNLPITPSSDFLPEKNLDAADVFALEDDCNVTDFCENSFGQGGGGLVNQLRKSYSLSDLREEQDGTVTDGGGSRLVRRNQPQGQSHECFYSTSGDYYQQQPYDPNGEEYYPDDVSSGYSSSNSLYYNTRRTKGETLVRTASLGPSSRTRAVTKNGLPKRASLSEGVSSWSALEPRESQNETGHYNFPLSHSASYPFPLTFQQYFIPGYQNMLGNFPPNQTLTFLNHPQYSQIFCNEVINLQNACERENDENLRNQSVLISEESQNNSNEAKPNVTEPEVTIQQEISDSTENTESEKEKITNKIADDETVKEVSVPSVSVPENLDEKEKQIQERSGKYNKKPAPIPPTKESNSRSSSCLAVEDEEFEFFTPNSSPKPARKQNADVEKPGIDGDPKPTATAEPIKKSKSKKGDFHISKKLHIPKMSFSFWHQKGGKCSDSDSAASVEVTSARTENQSETELFIPLKDPDEKESDVKEETDENKTGDDD